jgi:hypothetical protein
LHGQARLADLNRNWRVIILAALLIAAGWLRFTGTSFGLPQQFRPDEEFVVPKALNFDADWNPHWVLYPALQMYLLHGTLRADAIARGKSGTLHAIFDPNPQAVAYLIARGVSAAMGTATVAAVYLAAAPLCGPTGALASAAVVAFSTLHMRESKFAKLEVPAGLWVVLAIALMMRMVYRGRRSDYALAGLFCGLAGATHYPAGFVAAGVFVAHLEARRRENRALLGALGDGRIYLAGAVTIVTFCCATPYFFLDWAETVSVYRTLRGASALPEATGWLWVVKRMLPDSFGITLLIFLLATLVYAILRPRPGVISLLAFLALTSASLLMAPSLMYRYLVNPLLAMAVLAGVAIGDLTRLASARLGTTRASLLTAMLIGVILAPSLIHDLQLDRVLLQTDTRTLAGQWAAAHLAPGSRVAVTDDNYVTYGRPQLPDGCFFLDWRNLAVLRAEKVGWVLSDSMPGMGYSSGPAPDQLAALKSGADLLYDINPITDGAAAPIFDPDDAFYAPIQHIASMERPGPRIRIWKIKPA